MNIAQATKRMRATRDPMTALIIVVRSGDVVDWDDAAGPEVEEDPELVLLLAFVTSSA